MGRTLTAPGARLRCPWCRTLDDAARLVPCPRDATPIHRGCLEEFGCCPTCQGPVAGEAPPSGAREALSLGADPLAVAPLSPGLEWFVEQLPELYRRPVGAGWLLSAALVLQSPLLGGTLVALLGLCVLVDAYRWRTARRWLDPDALAGADDPRRPVALALARGDEQALADVEAHAAGLAAGPLLRAQLEELEVLRRERYRQALERRARRDGIADFEVPGKERIDAWIAARAASVRSWALGRVANARRARRRLEAWREERRGLVARLAA